MLQKNFIYSEKATKKWQKLRKFYSAKSKVGDFVAFSEYVKFI